MDINTARSQFINAMTRAGWIMVGKTRGIVTWESPDGDLWGIASYDRDGDVVVDMQVRLIDRHFLTPTGQVLQLSEI